MRKCGNCFYAASTVGKSLKTKSLYCAEGADTFLTSKNNVCKRHEYILEQETALNNLTLKKELNKKQFKK